METWVCHECDIFALAINYDDEVPICMCGLEMELEA